LTLNNLTAICVCTGYHKKVWGDKMPRKARLDAPGTLHHVIIRGIERRPIVDDEKDRENFVSRLGQLAAETETGIFAWTLMTNHAHILIKSGSFGLPNFMRRLLIGWPSLI